MRDFLLFVAACFDSLQLFLRDSSSSAPSTPKTSCRYLPALPYKTENALKNVLKCSSYPPTSGCVIVASFVYFLIMVSSSAYQKKFVERERSLAHVLLFQISDQFLCHFCFSSFTSNQGALFFRFIILLSKFVPLRFHVQFSSLNYSSGCIFSSIGCASFCV